jgi:hypothetical protein
MAATAHVGAKQAARVRTCTQAGSQHASDAAHTAPGMRHGAHRGSAGWALGRHGAGAGGAWQAVRTQGEPRDAQVSSTSSGSVKGSSSACALG